MIEAQLIRQLYLPGPPAKINKIQESLQALQKSPDGWQLADRLLESLDEKARFYGALTFTVKLNADWYIGSDIQIYTHTAGKRGS